MIYIYIAVMQFSSLTNVLIVSREHRLFASLWEGTGVLLILKSGQVSMDFSGSEQCVDVASRGS